MPTPERQFWPPTRRRRERLPKYAVRAVEPYFTPKEWDLLIDSVDHNWRSFTETSSTWWAEDDPRPRELPMLLGKLESLPFHHLVLRARPRKRVRSR